MYIFLAIRNWEAFLVPYIRIHPKNVFSDINLSMFLKCPAFFQEVHYRVKSFSSTSIILLKIFYTGWQNELRLG